MPTAHAVKILRAVTLKTGLHQLNPLAAPGSSQTRGFSYASTPVTMDYSVH